MGSFEDLIKAGEALDRIYRKMKEKGLTEAKATCPSCGEKKLRVKYHGPRSASAKCENPTCSFFSMS